MKAKMTTDLEKRQAAAINKGAGVLKSKIAEIKDLQEKLGRKNKYATLKKAELATEVAEDVKLKLVEEGVPEEAAETAKEIVEVAVAEASNEVPESVEGAVPGEEPAGEPNDEEILDEETKETLSSMATDEDMDDMVKSAAMNMLKGARGGKKAFAKALIETVKSAELPLNSGSYVVPGKGKKASGTVSQKSLQVLRNFANS